MINLRIFCKRYNEQFVFKLRMWVLSPGKRTLSAMVSANTVIKTITENSFLKDRSEKVNFELSKESTPNKSRL